MTGMEVRLPWTGSVPVLETGRLRLREYRLSDWPHVRDMWKDPGVTEYFGGAPTPEEEAWTKFLRKTGHWPLLGFGYWVAEDKQTGAFLGEAGFGNYKRDITPSLGDDPEIGWAIVSAAHGKGYASEAAKAAVEWGDAHFNGARMCCIISPGNGASIRIAEKCGFKETVRAVYHGEDILIFRRG